MIVRARQDSFWYVQLQQLARRKLTTPSEKLVLWNPVTGKKTVIDVAYAESLLGTTLEKFWETRAKEWKKEQ